MHEVILYKRELTYEQMCGVLKIFSKEVEDNRFIRVPYSDWTKISGARSLDTIYLEFFADADEPCNRYVRVKFGVSYVAGYFRSDDASIGEFLFETFYLRDNQVNFCDDEEVIDDLEENNNMKVGNGFNFDFGSCDKDNIRLSMYGLAIQNAAGTWVSYDQKNGTIIDVDILNFDGGRFMFKLPVTIKDIKVGDIIIHNRVPMFITEIDDAGKLFAVDVRAGEEKCIIPTRNMFGFDFVTKVVSLLEAMSGTPNPDQPFGNMLPMLLLGSRDEGNIDPLMLMFLTQGVKGIDASNPWMLYALMKDNDNTNSILPLLLLAGNK